MKRLAIELLILCATACVWYCVGVASRASEAQHERARHSMSDENETPPDITTMRGIGLSEPLLLDPYTTRRDSRLVSRAIKEGWAIPEDKRPMIIDRLIGIVQKTSIDVMTKFGPEAMDGPADVNAIAAARVIVQMHGQNQDDAKQPSQTNIQINVDPAEAGGVKIFLPHNSRD